MIFLTWSILFILVPIVVSLSRIGCNSSRISCRKAADSSQIGCREVVRAPWNQLGATCAPATCWTIYCTINIRIKQKRRVVFYLALQNYNIFECLIWYRIRVSSFSIYSLVPMNYHVVNISYRGRVRTWFRRDDI